MSGFILKKLTIIGPGLENASIDFKNGLNIISGPSDSGKSYIFDCINYMLGSSEKPKSFKENKGYNKAFLEIQFDEKIVTLERSLDGGEFYLYDAKTMDRHKLEPKLLKSEHEAGNLDTISGFLLFLSGFKTPTWLKKNLQNKKISLSFRHLKNYITISEERIITKASLFHTGQYTDVTREKAILKLLLTGIDDSKLEESEKPELKKAKISAKLDILNEMIKDTRDEIKNNNPEKEEEGIQQDITDLKESLISVYREIDTLNLDRKNLLNEIKGKESKVIQLNELIKRFILLEEQYETDINRLKFIEEGAHYFNQLNAVKCPKCGQDLKNDDFHLHDELNIESINEACLAEISKIQLNLNDLSKSKKNLRSDLTAIEKRLIIKREEYNSLVESIENVLKPKAEDIEKKLDVVLVNYKKISMFVALEVKLDNLLIRYENIEKTLKNSSRAQNEKKVDFYDNINDLKLKKYIASILINWGFSEVHDFNDLSFNKYERQILDIEISGKERKNYGKGYRALIYSAFVLGMMKYCENTNLPHPGFVLLDSPVTTFQDVKAKQGRNIEDEVIPIDKQEAFFKDLSENYYSNQVIILENKEPSDEIKGKINYIEFTKDINRGRYGFF